MSSAPSVSLIIPVFNPGPYIEPALASVADQDYDSLEVIMVDDGSFDGAGEICDRWSGTDSRFRAIHQPNAGISAARNRGLSEARGDYIMFMDHDDLLVGNAVSQLVRVASSSGATVVKFGVTYKTITTTGRVQSRRLTPRRARADRAYLARNYSTLRRLGVFTFVWNMMVARRSIESLNNRWFDGSFTVGGEDDDFNRRLLQGVDTIALEPTIYYEHWRRPGQSTVLRRDPRAVDNIRHLAETELSYMTFLGCDPRDRADVCVQHIEALLLNGRFAEGSVRRLLPAAARNLASQYGAPSTLGEWAWALSHHPRSASISALALCGHHRRAPDSDRDTHRRNSR